MSVDPTIAALEGEVFAAQMELQAADREIARNATGDMTPAYNRRDRAMQRLGDAMARLEGTRQALGDRVQMSCRKCGAQPGLSASAIQQAGGWYCPVCGERTSI